MTTLTLNRVFVNIIYILTPSPGRSWSLSSPRSWPHSTGWSCSSSTSRLWIMNMLTRKGVAKKLMQRVLQEAQERDVHNIISYVRNDNKVREGKSKQRQREWNSFSQAAIHINQKFGFGITSNDKRDPSLFVMEKMLHINNPAPASAWDFGDNLETIFDSTGLNWLGPPIMGKNTNNLKTTFGFCWKNFTNGQKNTDNDNPWISLKEAKK